MTSEQYELRLAEIAGEYLRKGSKVYIEGRLQTRKWQSQDGNDRYTTEIIANDMQMLDSRGGVSGGYQGPASEPPPDVWDQSPQPAQPSPQSAPKSPVPSDDFNDDIPF